MERKLFVGGLHSGITAQTLADAFVKYGPIEDSNIITDRKTGASKGYGFITYFDESCARLAAMDGQPIVAGKICNCNLATQGKVSRTPDGNGKRSHSTHSTAPHGQRRHNTSSESREAPWGEKKSKPSPNVSAKSTSYSQRLQEQGIVITIEEARDQIGSLRVEDPCGAYKFFLEVSDLFGDTEFQELNIPLLEDARRVRREARKCCGESNTMTEEKITIGDGDLASERKDSATACEGAHCDAVVTLSNSLAIDSLCEPTECENCDIESYLESCANHNPGEELK